MSPRKKGSAAAPEGVPQSAAVTIRRISLRAEMCRLQEARTTARAAARALLRASEPTASPQVLARASEIARAAAAELWEVASNVTLLSRLP